jgi:hypothetical protein
MPEATASEVQPEASAPSRRREKRKTKDIITDIPYGEGPFDGQFFLTEPSPEEVAQAVQAGFRGRIRHQTGRHHPLAHRRADHDDAAAINHVLQRRLRRDECAADIDVDQAK